MINLIFVDPLVVFLNILKITCTKCRVGKTPVKIITPEAEILKAA